MTGYWKSRLTGKQQTVYNDIYAAAQSGGSIALKEFDAGEFDACFQAVLDDNPSFFWLAPTFEVLTKMFMGMRRYEVRFSEVYPRRDVPKIQTALDAIARKFKGLSEEEAERAIAEHIVLNTTYAIDNLKNQNAAAALYFLKAQCSGISRAVKYLCDKLNIWCIVVSGEVKQGATAGPHSWNIVKINGVYYHLDVTTMLGSNLAKTKPLYYACFNYADSEMTTHAWNRASVPPCTTKYRMPANSGTQQSSGSSYGTRNTQSSNCVELKTLSEVRTLMKKEIEARKQTVTFALAMNMSVQEINNAVCNCIKMVNSTLNVRLSASVNVTGRVCTVNFSY